MPKLERGFVPIDEVNTGKVRFAVDLPHYLDRTQIRANTERIESLMKLGGVAHLRIETYDDDRVASVPIILGHDSQGEAYAGKAASKSETKNITLERRRGRGSPKVNALAKIDIQAISAKASDNLRSPEIFAREIDRAVLDAIRKAGNTSLVKQGFPHDAYQLSIYGVNRLIFGLENAGSVEGFATDSLLMYGILSPIFGLIARVYGRHDRFSLFTGPQLDRWGVLQARTRLQHVVKAEVKPD